MVYRKMLKKKVRAALLIQIKSPPSLRSINGIGGRVVGYHREPLVTDGYYKQFVMTILFMPVFFGHIYLVRDAKPQGWYFLGRIEGRAFVSRFGWKRYFIFKFSALLESAAYLAIFVVAVLFAVWVRQLLSGRSS